MYNIPTTVEDFCADYGYSVGLINLDHLFTLEQISRKNLRENGGTLGLTFFDMLKVLQKYNINPSDIHVYVAGKFYTRNIEDDYGEKNFFEAKEIYGYCLCYCYDKDKVQIAHICIDPHYQRMGFGQMLLEKASCNWRKSITADVYYDDKKLVNFFKKNGFEF